MRILQRSSAAILDCLMREMAVTSVSIALAKSPELASMTALLIAEEETVLLRWKISSNSCSLMAGGGGSECRLLLDKGALLSCAGGLPYGSVGWAAGGGRE